MLIHSGSWHCNYTLTFTRQAGKILRVKKSCEIFEIKYLDLDLCPLRKFFRIVDLQLIDEDGDLKRDFLILNARVNI